MKRLFKVFSILIVTSMVLNGCQPASPTQKTETLREAREKFKTEIVNKQLDEYPVDIPPEEILDLVKFPSAVGELDAYISKDPNDGQKHPAIIWITGGWSNSISATAWELAPLDNDQSARAFYESGVVTMYPSKRGGNENINSKEAWYGEIDDIVSAYEYLASISYVDPSRIYLGGHSTGGSQAILAAEYFDKFRAVFSFGPKGSVSDSDSENFTFDPKIEGEIELRSPIKWLNSITTPVYIIEGQGGNATFVNDYLKEAKKASKNELVSGYIIKDADHFSPLTAITPLIAQKILADTGEKTNITFTEEELKNAMENPKIAKQEFKNKGNSYKVALSGGWRDNGAETDDDLSVLSYDDVCHVSLFMLPKESFENFEQFAEAEKAENENATELSPFKDIAIPSVKQAQQTTRVFDASNVTLMSNTTLIQTNKAYYVLNLVALEEDYLELEKELTAIPLTFEEISN